MHLARLFVAFVVAGLAAGAAPAELCQTRPASEELLIEWTNLEGALWTLRARIDRPAPGADRRRAVFMFGGGFSNDLDWTTPGRLEHEGKPLQLTITGEDARDGAVMAKALLEAGWTVIRYSAIREGDPLHAQSRGMAEAMPYPGTLELARFMWSELPKRAEIAPERIVALGHSLGATRALHATDGKAAGYVFLAGAYLSPTGASPRRIASEELSPFGEAGADGVISRHEASVTNLVLPADFDAIDRDRSGDLAGWELAAARRMAGPIKSDEPAFGTEPPMDWPTDILAKRDLPALAIWGGLDSMSFHGPLLEHLAQREGIPLRTRYFTGLGHNLGPIQGERAGPVAPQVITAIVEWLDLAFPREQR